MCVLCADILLVDDQGVLAYLRCSRWVLLKEYGSSDDVVCLRKGVHLGGIAAFTREIECQLLLVEARLGM